jgi:23S rRNA pseudouridine2605 synthase
MSERLQKILSQWGIASRRQAEQLLLEGRVRLNGKVGQLGQKADPDLDCIEVDGQRIYPVQRPALQYLLLHKPVGVVSTCQDPWNRPTVLDLLPVHLQTGRGIHPIGRLDTDSTGALLLTNDGALTFGLTHPRHQIAKTYQVWVEGHPPEAVLKQWRHGIVLSGRSTLPARVRRLAQQPTQTLLEVILSEGRNRQIRRIAEQLGHPVKRLHRSAIGPIQLSNLTPGAYRPLQASEVQALQQQIQRFSVCES